MNTQKPPAKHEMAFCESCKRRKSHRVCFDLKEEKHLMCCDCGTVKHPPHPHA